MQVCVIPTEEEMADCNWFDWVVVVAERGVFDDVDPTRARCRDTIQTVDLNAYLDGDRNLDTAGYEQALRLAFTDAGMSVAFVGTGKLEWPGGEGR